MKKKELLKINDELFERCESLIFKVEELKREVFSLKNEIEILKSEKETAVVETDALKFEVCTPKTTEKTIDLPNDTKYGAQVIGEIVMTAAKYCNQLSVKGSSEITKEQINLILGRTEVAKAEILKAITENMDFEDKKSAVNAAAKSAKDYFYSVMAQTE